MERLGAFAAAVAADDADGLDALASATARGADAVGDGLSVWPNPAASRAAVWVSVRTPARVAVATPDGSSVDVSVYDALGRRVSVLHDGAVPAGGLALALDGARLPAGVYVVHARVTTAGSEAQTLVRRVTVAR